MTTKTVVVRNSTLNGAVIGDQIECPDSIIGSFFGLMGRREIPSSGGMLLRPCSSIHTSFMRIPIDVVYINKHNVVLAIDNNLPPWRLGRIRFSTFSTSTVLELPAGTAASGAVRRRDKLLIEEAHQ